MKRNLSAAFLIFGVILLALAVAAPNFSGTWVRDKAKSDPMGFGRRGGEAPPDIEVTMTIKQEGNAFDVSTQRGDRTMDSKYTLDGKETTNTTGRGSTVSKANWDGDNLVIDGTRKFSGPNGEMEMKFKEVYSLSADGKTLTVTSTNSTPNGERTSKQVYNKK